MKKFNILILAVTVLFFACESDTVPITTNSDQAREEFLIARDLFDKIRYQDAKEYLERAIGYDSTFALAYIYLANTIPNVTERYALLEKAKSYSEKASKGERLYILGYEAGTYGYSKKQESYFQELVEAYPNDERAMTDLGNFYFSQREYDKAIVYYKRASQLNPKFSLPYNQMGYIYRYQKNYQAAEESFKKYIKLIPDDPNPYDSYAELLLKMGEYELSIENYEKALEIDPDFAPSHLGIASNLIYMHEYQKARAQLIHLYKIAHDDVQRINAHFGLAISYLAEDQIDNALNEIEKLYQMAKDENDISSMIDHSYVMALILYEFDRLAEAEQKLNQSKELLEGADILEGIKNNLERRYWYHKSRLAIKENHMEEASNYAENYHQKAELTENPTQMMTYHTLSGLIANADKNYSMAISEFQKSNLDDPFNRYQLAQAYTQNGNKDKAIEELDYVVNYNGLLALGYMIVRNRAEKQLALLRMS